MPYKTFWYEENRVVFAEILEDFTVEEMVSLNQEYDTIYFMEGHKPIHLIADLRGMSNYPKNLIQIRDITRQTALQPGLGSIILIGTDNALVKFLSTTIFQLLHVNCKIVGSLEEAEKILDNINFADSNS